MRQVVVLLMLLLTGCVQADTKEVTATQLLQRQASSEPVLIVDVRTPEEFAAGHVPGAVNLPVEEISGQEPVLQEWKQKPVVLYCHSGRRATRAGAVLEKAGFGKLEHLTGDMTAWQAQGRPVDMAPCAKC